MHLHHEKRYLKSLVIALLVAPPALAQKADAWLRMTSPSLNHFNASGVEADEKFFNVKGAPPNVMFLVDTSESMRELVEPSQSAATRAQGTGCSNILYNAILDSGNFNPEAPLGTYPHPDQGVAEAGVDPGFPNLFREGDYYVNEAPTSGSDVVDGLTDSGAPSHTRTAACTRAGWTAVETTACLECMSSRGYFLDPTNERDVFSGRFLNFYPPKFVVARTVIKRTVWDVKSVRMGLSTFDGSLGANLQAGLNPPCHKSLDPEDASWTNNRKSILNTINNTSKFKFAGKTPLAEALLNVGQLFTTDASVFDNWFGTGWTKNEFAAGSVSSESRSVCFGCQVSSVVLITDGAPSEDNCVPQCIRGVGADCPGCNAGSGTCGGACPNKCGNTGACVGGSSDCCDGDPNNYLDDVAQWLWEHDLQTKNPANGKWSADGRQRLATYTVGFGFDHPLLENTASVGGGKYFYSNDSESLTEAIYKIIDDVNRRATTFGVSSISTLQTSSGISTLVPRFIPGSADEDWKGLLYRFGVDNEQINGCVATLVDEPAHPMDRNGDHDCDDLFYTDRDGDVVEEDALTGLFLKASSSNPAKPVWEAGAVLTYATPTYSGTETRDDGAPGRRKIYTVVDSNDDGKLTSSDGLIDFTEDNAALLMGAMGLGTDVSGDPICKQLYLDLAETTVPLDQWGEACARVVIRHYRGWRATEKDPNVRTQSRAWLLGDIFHASPVIVEPPILPESCAFFPGQCLPSLWVKEGKFDDAPTRKAYRDWVSGNHCGGGVPCEERRSFVLVGANGGFLHAFDSGGHAPPSDPSAPERDVFSGRLPYDHGTGRELWAFVPPDLLRVMKDGLGRHTYFVDGTAMVRDVWIDQDADGEKEADEFRTVAVVGERGGGNHFFALDVTANMGSATGKPEFLWMWPQPGDPRIADVADTFSNFHPRPPPIGPVLLEDGGGFEFRYQKQGASGSTEVVTNARERWVVGLNGGPDRALQRGRGVALVDVWTGETHWDSFWEPGLDASDPRSNLRHPVGAGMGLLDIGSGEHSREAPFDGYFDAFTVGDLGGNLWVGRMHAPGERPTPTSPVSNWEAARGFEVRKGDGGNVRNRRPISYITSNSLQRSTGYLRTFFGTGDRSAILEKGGGTCSLDNPRTCLEMGCRVEVSQWRRNLPEGDTLRRTRWEALTGVQSAAIDEVLTGCPSTSCLGPAISTCSTACSTNSDPADCLHKCSLTARTTCGATAGNCTDAAVETGMMTTMTVSHCPTATTTASSGKRLTRMLGNWCEGSGGAARCRQELRFNDKDVIDYQPAALAALPKHGFFGAHVYGGQAGPYFNTRTEAVAFDTARRTETDLVDLGMITAASTTTAPQDSKGWRLAYETSDERTASPSGMVVSLDGESVCVVWNTLTPTGTGNICGGSGSQLARLVQADFVTGSNLCLEQFPAGQRFVARAVLVPPPEPTPVIGISASGVTSGLVLAEPGSNPQSVRGYTAQDPLQPVFQLELTRPEHQCRHEAISAACGP